MSLSAKVNENNFVSVPPGMHLARCYRVVDLGSHPGKYVNPDGSPKYANKVVFFFEVHGEDGQGNKLTTSRGEPLMIHAFYNNSLSEKSPMRTQLESWRGMKFTEKTAKEFNMSKLLGVWGMITVVDFEKDGKVYNNIVSINPVPKMIKDAGLPDGHNPLVIFDFDAPDMTVFDSLPPWIQKKIMASKEWAAMHSTASPEDYAKASGKGGISGLDDEIPF